VTSIKQNLQAAHTTSTTGNNNGALSDGPTI
jgi:hypothetical protein